MCIGLARGIEPSVGTRDRVNTAVADLFSQWLSEQIGNSTPLALTPIQPSFSLELEGRFTHHLEKACYAIEASFYGLSSTDVNHLRPSSGVPIRWRAV